MNAQGSRASLGLIALQIAVFALFIILWEGYIQIADVPPFLLPGPEAVGSTLWQLVLDGTLWHHAGVTLMEVCLGFVIGAALGALIGYVLAVFPAVEELFQPYILFAQTAPKIALIPLFVIWFGLGLVSKVVLIVSMVFFPVMVNTVVGLRSVPKELDELMTILKATAAQRFFQVRLPSALPLFMAGLRLAMIQAVIGAIVAEWMAGKSGLGYLLVFGSTTYNAPLLMAAIIATSLLGVITYGAVAAVERWALRWHDSTTDLDL